MRILSIIIFQVMMFISTIAYCGAYYSYNTTGGNDSWCHTNMPSFTIDKKYLSTNDDIKISASDFTTHLYCDDECYWASINFKIEYSINGGSYQEVPKEAIMTESWKENIYKKECGNKNVWLNFSDKWNLKGEFKSKELLGSANFSNKQNRIEFRFTINGNSSVCVHSNPTLKETTYTATVIIYNCSAGTIKPDESITPNIGTNDLPIYAIYNDQTSQNWSNSIIPILVDEPAAIFSTNTDQYLYTYVAENNGLGNLYSYDKRITNWEDQSQYNWAAPIKGFLVNGQMNDGDRRSVVRQNVYPLSETTIQCESPKIIFQAVKALSLPNLRLEEIQKEEINYVCPEESSSAYECGKGGFSIEGNLVELGTDNSIDYGIEYGWEYKTAGSSSWKTVNDNLNTDKSDPILCLPYSFIKGTTLFRQVVKSTKFNKTIYCDAVGSSAEWQSYVVYNRYSPITAENFTITDTEKICYGESFGENAGSVTVEFLPTTNLVYSSKEGSAKENDFTYLWKKGSQTLTESSNSVHCNDVVTEDITYTVSVTDGCGTTIKLSALKEVKDKPTLSAQAFNVENANITKQEDNFLEIETTKDATVLISIIEEGKSGYEYYLVTPSDDLETGPIYQKLSTQWGNPFNPEKITSLIECQTKYGNSSVYLVKKLNGCESEPVYLQIRQIDDIYNNIIIGEGETLIDDIPTILVCSGSSLPAFSGYTPEGGYTNGEYTYVWESTPDPSSVSWAQIVGTDLTMKDLKSGAIASIESPIYIRRTVYSKSGNGSIKNSSSYRKVMPYEEPTFKVNIKTTGDVASSPLSLKLCYNQTAYFGYSYSNASFTEQYNVEVPTTTYILTDPETAEVVNSSKNDRYSFNKNLILTAQMEFCGKKFSSENQIAVNVGENLQTSLNDLSFSSCLMEGGEFTASIKDPGSYSYSFSDKNGVTLSEKSSATISIPAANNNNDVTFYISKSDDINGCSQSSTITVAGNKIMKPLENTNLIVTGYAKNQDGDYLICNGEAITITPAAGSVEDSRLSYEWIIDDKSSTFVESSLSNLTFSDYGVKHVIKRITTYRVGTVLCSQIEDVVNVYTREKITSLYVPSASTSTICYEENASLSFNKNALTGGSGDYSYQWSKSSDQDGTYVDCSNGDNITYVDNNLKKDSWYKLTVSDNGCSGGSYIKEFSPVKVTVIPDLSFSASDVSISPTAISLADYETGEPNAFVTVSDNKDMNAVDGLKWGFYMNDALLASKTTQSHQYSISKELADANSEIGFCISRNVTISADKVCVAKFCGAIPVNQGFTSDFTITSEFGSSIKACPTEKISIQTENMPLYNNIELDEKYITYQWRRRIDTLASWVNISGATENVLEVSPNGNGINYVYACQISYTSDGSVHKILSNEITVEGYKKQTSGVVSIMSGEYISNSSNSFEYTLEMYDSWSGKDGWTTGNEEVGYYITFDNNTDDKYFVEYGSNQNIVSIELDGSIHTMQLHIDKLTFIQEISFVFKDADGNVLYEKNTGDFNSSSTEGITTLYSFDPHASYDENSRKGSISVCKGSEVNVLMEYSGASNGSYQWQYSTDGENWQDLKADNSIMNVNTSSLTYRNENITETTQFRCLATDFCGDVTYSSNVTSIFVNKDISISANEIMMLSSKVVPASTQHVDKISLTIPTDSKSDYYWYYYDDNITGGGNSIEFTYDSDAQVLPKEDGEIGNFYTAGTHTINVYKINKLSGCVSETIPYSYTLYNSLSVLKVANTANTDTLCKGSQSGHIVNVVNIKGGNPNSEYQVTWYYKTGSMDYFAPLVNGDASIGFDFLIGDNHHIENINGLTSTTSFYCKVVSPGYPGRDAISNTTTIYVYKDLNAGEINKDQTSLCYGQSSEIENVSIAHGGSGSYSYDWISSVDNGETWSFNTSSSAYASLISTGDLHESTMYKRVVNDLVCNTKDTTNYSKIFRVIDPVIISGSDIRATQIVTIGNKATIQGQSPDFDYLLIKDDGISVIDTIKGQSPYITEPLLAKTNYMVKKINGWGCMSTNDTIITIDVKEPINGGKLMFENNVDWACSGSDSIGRIINYTEPSGIDLSYKWFYCSSIVDGVCNSPIMGKNSNKQVTTKTVDLDTCGVKFDNTSGKDMVYYFYRLTYGLDETGTQTVVPSDTISLHIAPTLKSVNDNLIDGLAGSLSASQTDYCIGDKGEIINHVLSSTALSAWRDNSFGSLPYGGSLMVYWESADGIVSTASTNGNFSMIEGTESNFTDNAK
ncbi:MAG TPA: hypothetical protein PKW49_11065, partial [Paludibacteraceae bacterium]|nr:hypothetical protein [Paludibacteraceae bacterium]